jgi:hypothetical protein
MPVQLRHRQRSFPRSSRTTARYEPPCGWVVGDDDVAGCGCARGNLGVPCFTLLSAELLHAEAPPTVEALWSAVGRMLDRFTPADVANYLAHDGNRHSV